MVGFGLSMVGLTIGLSGTVAFAIGTSGKVAGLLKLSEFINNVFSNLVSPLSI